jgi:hypothetical protein
MSAPDAMALNGKVAKIRVHTEVAAQCGLLGDESMPGL